MSVSNHSYSQLPAKFDRITNFKIEKRDSLYGALDSNGKILIPFEYQSLVSGWNDDNFIVKKNGLYGIVNIDNCVLLPITFYSYDRLANSRPYFELHKNGKILVFNRLGKQLNSMPFDQMELTNDETFLIRNDNTQFLMDTFGNIITKGYCDIIPITNNRYIVIDNNDTLAKNYLITRNTRNIDVLRPFPYYCFEPNRQSSGIYGLIDDKGQEMLPLKYDYLGLNDNLILAVLNKNNKNQFGYFDRNGREIIPVMYDSISNLVDNTIVVKLNNKYRLFNSKGKPFISINFDSIFFQNINYSKNAYFSVYKNGKCGLLNTNGKFILPMKYQNIGIPNYNLVNVRNNNKMGFLDLKGNIKIGLKYDQCSNFLYGYARVSRNNKIGFIDTTGKVIIPIIYDASSFLYDSRDFDLKSYFRIKVKLGNRIFWINERNQYIEEAKDE